MAQVTNTKSKVNSNTSHKQYPTIQGYPLIGVAHQLVLDTLGLFQRTAQKYPGDLVALNLGFTKVYLVSHPDDVQYVLSTKAHNFDKGLSSKFSPSLAFKQLIGEGIGSIEEETWSRNRRLMQPSFAPKKVAALADRMLASIIEFLPRLEQVATQTSVDIGLEMMQINQVVLLQTIFGTSISQNEIKQIAEATLAFFKLIQFQTFFFFLPKFLPLSGDKAIKQNATIVRNIVLSIIRNRRISGKLGDDLLSLLLQAGDEATQTGMDNQQLLDECVTLFVGGNETTGTTLTWFWYLVGQHPEVEDKLRAEIDSVIGKRMPTLTDLAQLTYLRMVIQETMRFYPSVAGFLRRVVENDSIHGYQIDANSYLLVISYLTHHLAEFWENPEIFDPERFAPERQRHPFAYCPFGGGARRCIGEHFAMMNMQLIIVTILQRWRLRCVPEHPVVPEIHSFVLSTKYGIQMTLESVLST